MPAKGKYKTIPRVVTQQDKTFIKLVAAGEKRAKAYRIAYPDNPAVVKYMDMIKNNQKGEERMAEAQKISVKAKSKLQTNHIQAALMTYQKKMDEFSDKSLDTAIDLVENARSEKVRADLAIEGIRHRVGTPVQKMQVQQAQDIYITFGDKHPNDRPDVIDLDDDGVIE